MSATEELRRLLDERGVRYETNEDERDPTAEPERTYWEYDQCGHEMYVSATEVVKPYLDLDFHYYHTPEQAIAATLGLGTCRNTEQLQLAWSFTCSECGVHSITEGKRFSYCPNCGAKIEVGDAQ